MSTRKDQLKSLLLNLPPQGTPAPEQKSAGVPVGGAGAGAGAEQGNATVGDAPPRAVSGSIRAMGLSLDRLGAAAEEADALRAELAASERVIEIDPAEIAPSFIADRMPEAGQEAANPEFDAFVADIRDHGQQSPVLVRPDPDGGNRYQIAYGHRRWRAARALGRKLKAVVRPLSDAELVVAQGQENAQRRDLSFIEKAFFARTLDERGFDRATLVAALGVQTAEISRLLQVARAIPARIAGQIGPAPKAGRPRWMALAEGMEHVDALARVSAVLESETTRALASDERFARAFAALKPPGLRRTSPDRVVRDGAGLPLARLALKETGAQLALDPRLEPDFASHVADALPGLYARWRAANP